MRAVRADGGVVTALAKADHRHAVVQWLDLPLRGATAAKLAGATAVGNQAIAMDQDRVAVFQHLDIARGQRTETAFRTHRVPAVHVRGGAGAADQRGQHHGHIVLLIALVVSGDIDAARMAPGTDGAFGRGLFQRQTHRIGQGFHRRGGAVHVRRWLLRIAQRSLGPQVDADAAVQAFVVRRRDLGEHHQAEVNPGIGIAGVGIDEVRNLRRALDSDMALVTRNAHGGANFQLAKTMAGIFQHGRGFIAAVRHPADQVAHAALGHVEQFVQAGLHYVHAVLVQQRNQVALADLHRAELRSQIAFPVAARTHVGQQQIDYILALAAPFVQFDRWNAQAFGVQLFRVRVVASGHRAAYVGDVPLAHAPEHQPTLVEHRLVHAAVENVAAHHHRVVVVNHIALVNVIAKVVGHSLHRRHQTTQMDGNVLPLDDHLGAMIEQRIAVVMRHVEHAGACRFLQRQGHFALRCFQHAADHGEGDRIDLALLVAHRCLQCLLAISGMNGSLGLTLIGATLKGLCLRAQAFAHPCTLGKLLRR